MAELVFLLSADIEIQGAYETYQAGRGIVFMQHLDVAFSHLRRFPEIGPIFHGTYRRLLVPGFPYGIFLHDRGRTDHFRLGDGSVPSPRNHYPATSQIKSPAKSMPGKMHR
jgi:hypothetical protein